MAGKHTKNSGFISLNDHELSIVAIQKVVEHFWFDNPKGWWVGPDGQTQDPELKVNIPWLYYPGIKDAMIAAGVMPGFLPHGDWIPAEYIHSSQIPRCVPVAINSFIEQYFGADYTLFGHQLAMYYSPQHYNIVVGGRGSGKTVPLAIIMAIWTALHPGEPWLHVALSLDQAKKAFSQILDLASRRHYLSTGELTERTFSEVFIQDRREFPQPDIYFRPWDEHDAGEVAGKQQPGNVIMFRPLGDDDLERLRSTEAGCASGDEVLREIDDEKTIRHVRGCLRGLNPWLRAHLPAEKRAEINMLQRLVGLGNVTGNKEMVTNAENKLRKLGVDRSKRFFAVGNAGEPDWVWQIMDIVEDEKEYAWFIQVTMYDNIRLSPEDRETLENAWGTDPDARQVELLARRPIGLGTQIDPQLLFDAVRHNLGGTVHSEHRSYGIIHYEKAPIPGHFYIIAGDPGKARLPERNSWCVMVLDITAFPAEIVYFQMGNLAIRSKTYKPYLDSYRHVVRTYPVVSPIDIIYDNGGQQSGMHEVILEELKQDAGDEMIYGNPQDFSNAMKYTAANWLIDLLRKGLLVMPELPLIIRQVSNWTLPDKKIAQDAAMTLFMLVYRSYYILSDASMQYGRGDREHKEFDKRMFMSWNPNYSNMEVRYERLANHGSRSGADFSLED